MCSCMCLGVYRTSPAVFAVGCRRPLRGTPGGACAQLWPNGVLCGMHACVPHCILTHYVRDAAWQTACVITGRHTDATAQLHGLLVSGGAWGRSDVFALGSGVGGRVIGRGCASVSALAASRLCLALCCAVTGRWSCWCPSVVIRKSATATSHGSWRCSVVSVGVVMHLCMWLAPPCTLPSAGADCWSMRAQRLVPGWVRSSKGGCQAARVGAKQQGLVVLLCLNTWTWAALL